ncbi:16S rRNA (cytosine(967)-C(5))-methyltransferase RsmB [Burkholderia multivorans]|uniref:16S rRNA (cytosine(967)-C(5))-methyltransferase RsmB n=1 Tax=Burkholderia multivorans TaxID=87883 RepID=UPI000CFEED6E|nr:16S rRNA (cytosine(967)-C(5))-methyltransferase RsmB [Burkholderia multivorans]MDN7473939.1 16S rRNA (cytosine(967)-C(5))-methyltransferase RsmB [Burkholderia multivorans]MDR8875726.1 Ribosomal RNA small subunit methyltransferase B [Burkholderia multivorans]MDR8880306.1 Ribosomal RNA small subunit methyltransferase B [Burkholderia multivorans]MDR8887225.1 Ribosomal RNA small subunit methyltransferase B [Burkholderia multivorans]MDR8893304.1 Ribosomal RNA small subunit methyltransferase B [B
MTRTRSASPSSSGRAARLSALRVAPDSLGFVLDAAAQAVDAVRRGTALPAALSAVFAQMASGAQALARGATQDVAYRTMRRLGSVDWLIARLVGKAPPAHVHAVLASALALLLDADGEAAYSPFTVVDQAVTAIGARREYAFAKGMVNAVLRRFLRERDTLVAAMHADPVAQWNYRAWWIDAVKRAWPDAWQAILAAGDRQGPLTLRVNARRASVDAYLGTLRDNGIEAAAIGRHAVRLASALPVERIPGFADGVVSVQDAGAQLAAEWLGARDGMRVLDACAAPGGKTGHILELADAEVVALESDASRATRIGENLARLSLAAEVRVGDAGAPDAWYDGRPFDRILADVPCSASGIVRRHPDIRWLRREADIPALVAEQRRILSALWPLVKPGGELLYVTCSIFPEEGEQQARWFEAACEDAVRLDAPGQLLPRAASGGAGSEGAAGVPDPTTDHDGFFYARFQKR